MEHRGSFGSRYDDGEERRWESSRAPGDDSEARRYRDEGYYSGYNGGGRGGRRPLNRMGERGFFDRAGDEVRSWFGDEEAERRRGGLGRGRERSP